MPARENLHHTLALATFVRDLAPTWTTGAGADKVPYLEWALPLFQARCAIIKNMATKIGTKASIPNPALEPFGALVGEWQTAGSHPYFPNTALQGRTSFDWLEGGAFLIMRSEIDEPHFPDGVGIFGSDDVAGKFFMLYFDERGVSRVHEVAMVGNQLRWWRDEPSFSQRFVITIEDAGNKMIGKGEMSRDGAAWEKDLELTYTRIR